MSDETNKLDEGAQGAVPNEADAAPVEGAAQDDGKRHLPHHLGRIILGIVVVAAVCLGLLAGLSVVFQPKDNTLAAGQLDIKANGVMGEPADTIDVVFLGDSEVRTSVSPLQMYEDQGFTSYVCGSNGQTLPYTYTLLKRAFKTQHPRVVVIEASSAFMPFSIADGGTRWLKDVFPFLEYHDRWKSLTPEDFYKQPTATWTDPLKGFHYKGATNPAEPEFYETYMLPTDQQAELGRAAKLYLEMIVELCRENGATPILVATPSLVTWSKERQNTMVQVAQELGVEFIDLNEPSNGVTIDWLTETCDCGNHVNIAGANKVTHFLSGYLDQKFDLPDHRGDPQYSQWEQSLAAYKTIFPNFIWRILPSASNTLEA